MMRLDLWFRPWLVLTAAGTLQGAPVSTSLPAWVATSPTGASVRVAVPPSANLRWAHLSWPKALRSHDGTIILAYLAGEFHGAGGGKSPAVSLSTDNGRTFGATHVLREFGPGLESTSSGNLALGLTEDRAVVLLAMGYRGDEANNIHGWRSTDDGRTWQPVDTSNLGPNKTGSVVGNIITLPGGKLMVHGHYRKGAKPHHTGIWQSISNDHGRTWGAPQMVSDVDGGEPVLIRSGDRLLSFIRGRGEHAIRQYLAVSDDFGKTWKTSLTKIEASDRGTKGLAHPFAMVDPDRPGEVVVLTTERPLPGRVWLWRGNAQTLEWKRDRVLLEFPKLGNDRNTDYGYTWLLRTESRHHLMFYYHGLNHGPNSIWVTEVSL